MNNNLENHNDIFNKDPALDFMIIEDLEQEIDPPGKNGRKNNGCFGLALILLLPIGSFALYFLRY